MVEWRYNFTSEFADGVIRDAGKDFLREVIQIGLMSVEMYKMQTGNSDPGSSSIHPSYKETLYDLFVKNKLITRNTKYLYMNMRKLRDGGIIAGETFWRITIRNGSNKELLLIDATKAFRAKVFSDEAVAV